VSITPITDLVMRGGSLREGRPGSVPRTLPMIATHGAVGGCIVGSGIEAEGIRLHLGLELGASKVVCGPSRPCFLPEIWTDPKGKVRKIYRYETMM
jgi:hypothetical protein